MLIKFEEDFEGTFPVEWAVDERICLQFCHVTSREISSIMAVHAHEIDVKLLLQSIQRASIFEAFLTKRFQNSPLKPQATDNIGDGSHFSGIIAKCFEPHLHIYIESQDKNLSELLEKFAEDLKTSPDASADAVDGVDGGVLPSAGELFVFYKKCMVQCIQVMGNYFGAGKK